MATITNFEDLTAWKKARILAQEIYKISSHGRFAKDFGLRNQINNSSGSVMDNIAEGFERNGNKEFIQFLSIAKGSCGEVRSQLYRVLDRSYVKQDKFKELYDLSNEISNHIGGLMKHLRTTKYKGTKFK